MANISTSLHKSFSKLATIKNPKSYGEWLAQHKVKGIDAARGTLAASEKRNALGYGVGGEELARTSLSDDGYAAYLRRAAKEKREERYRLAEATHRNAEKNVLAGYADYLRGLRDEDAERLLDAADDILSLGQGVSHLAEGIATEAEATDEQRRALMKLYREKPATEQDNKKQAALLEFLIEERYPYDRAYEYCLLMGLDEDTADRMATAAVGSLDLSTQKMYELFGYGKGK